MFKYIFVVMFATQALACTGQKTKQKQTPTTKKTITKATKKLNITDKRTALFKTTDKPKDLDDTKIWLPAKLKISDKVSVSIYIRNKPFTCDANMKCKDIEPNVVFAWTIDQKPVQYQIAKGLEPGFETFEIELLDIKDLKIKDNVFALMLYSNAGEDNRTVVEYAHFYNQVDKKDGTTQIMPLWSGQLSNITYWIGMLNDEEEESNCGSGVSKKLTYDKNKRQILVAKTAFGSSEKKYQEICTKPDIKSTKTYFSIDGAEKK